MLNNVILQGRLSQDLELRYTPSNTAVMTVNLAVQRSRKDNSGAYPTDFIPCVFWGKEAENVSKFFAKGDMILVHGTLETRRWQDKDGKNRASYEVQVRGFDFVAAKKETSHETKHEQPDTFTELDDSSSDVPF